MKYFLYIDEVDGIPSDAIYTDPKVVAFQDTVTIILTALGTWINKNDNQKMNRILNSKSNYFNIFFMNLSNQKRVFKIFEYCLKQFSCSPFLAPTGFYIKTTLQEH